MSQDASPTSTLPNPIQRGSSPWASGESGKSGGFSVESYADRLMDELFEGVEQSLEMGSNPPELVPVSASAPELLSPTESPLVVQSATEPLILETESAESTEIPVLDAPPPTQPQRFSRSYDRFLLGFGCLALVAAGVLWLLLRTKQPAPIATVPQPSASPVNPADRQFADYAKQALQALADRSPTAGKPVNPAIASLPSVPVPKNPTTPTRVAATGAERLAAPTYPVPPNLLPRTNVAPSIPAPAPRSPEATRPVLKKTLVGVMELGDRSAALVEIAGVVQRFRIGESISASGWTLVEISKNQAVIRRNGEVRSIFIGQDF